MLWVENLDEGGGRRSGVEAANTLRSVFLCVRDGAKKSSSRLSSSVGYRVVAVAVAGYRNYEEGDESKKLSSLTSGAGKLSYSLSRSKIREVGFANIHARGKKSRGGR